MPAQPILQRALVVAIFAVAVLAGCAAEPSVAAPRKTLQAFASDQEIADLFKRWAEDQQRRRDEARSSTQAGSSMLMQGMGAMSMDAAAPAAKMAAQPAAAAESITNV